MLLQESILGLLLDDPASGDHLGIDISGDGTQIAVSTSNGNVYKSIDSGINWVDKTNNLPSAYWFSLAASDDLNKLLVAEFYAIFNSLDGGNSWSQVFSSNDPIAGLACNFDCSVAYLLNAYTSSNTCLYKSTNQGSNWSPVTANNLPLSGLEGLGVSRDGTKLAVTEGFTLWISTDSGLNWNPKNLPRSFSGVAFDGVNLAISSNNGFGAFLSKDAGLNFNQLDSSSYIYYNILPRIAASTNFTTIVVTDQYYGVYMYTQGSDSPTSVPTSSVPTSVPTSVPSTSVPSTSVPTSVPSSSIPTSIPSSIPSSSVPSSSVPTKVATKGVSKKYGLLAIIAVPIAVVSLSRPIASALGLSGAAASAGSGASSTSASLSNQFPL